MIRNIIDDYNKASDQSVEWRKSEVYFLNFQPRMQVEIARILDLKIVNFLSRFLGMPLFAGINKKFYWESLIKNCKKRMKMWKGKWVTSEGRILMFKVVLFAILIYSISCMKIPKAVEDILNQIFQRFFLNGSNDTNKFPFLL